VTEFRGILRIKATKPPGCEKSLALIAALESRAKAKDTPDESKPTTGLKQMAPVRSDNAPLGDRRYAANRIKIANRDIPSAMETLAASWRKTP
jgi:hypothetical protein